MSGFYSEDLLDDVRRANPIYDVVSDYLPLKKSGSNFKGVCPFHGDKDPSFTVNVEREAFHCFGCGEGGSVFTFIMKQEALSFPESVRFLARRKGITLPETSTPQSATAGREKERLFEANTAAAKFFKDCLFSPQGKKPLSYLLNRGLTRETIDGFSLGFAPTGWDRLLRSLTAAGFKAEELLKAGLVVPRSAGGYIDRFRSRVIFPIEDLQGRVIGFGGRIIGEGEPKYLNSPETPLYRKSRVLYGMSKARKAVSQEGYGILVEGYFDQIHPYQAGICNVAATSGTALTEGHIDVMRRYSDRWTVIFDGDAAGIRAAKKSLELFVSQGIFARAVLLPDGKDPDTFISERGENEFRTMIEEAESLMDFFIRRTAQEHRIETVEGKVAAAREIVPLLARVRGRIEKAEYVARAAQLLKVKEEVLWAEVGSRSNGDRKNSSARRDVVSAAAPKARAEEVQLIKAMLANGTVAAEMREEIAPEEFENEDCRVVVSTLFSFSEEEKAEQSMGRLHFSDERINRLVASWLVNAVPLQGEEEYRGVARDCLARIRRRRMEEESRLLQEKIVNAEKAGEKDLVRKLLTIKHSLRAQT